MKNGILSFLSELIFEFCVWTATIYINSWKLKFCFNILSYEQLLVFVYSMLLKSTIITYLTHAALDECNNNS